jgi:hypothetical protein
MKVLANQATIDTIVDQRKIEAFNGNELNFVVNGMLCIDLYISDETMCCTPMQNLEDFEVELDHDGMFDLVVERIKVKDITNLMFW